MRMSRWVAVLSAVLLGMPAISPAADDYQSQGFETPAFQVGPLAGQHDWRVVDVGGKNEDAMVQTQDVYQGKQALELGNVGRRVVARLTQVRRETFYVDLHIKPPLPESIQSNAALRLRGRDQDSQAGILIDVSFNRSGAINDVPKGPHNQYTPGTWTRLTIKVNPEADNWSLYLDGKPVGVDMPVKAKTLRGISHIDSFDLDWTSKPDAAGQGLLVDNFSITATDPLSPGNPSPGQ